jgi:ceramide glucosyltransferase
MANPIELTALGALTVSSAMYLTMLTSFSRAWSRRPRRELARCPRITIFKPVAGLDDDLRENLESFAALDYPAFELLFGVADLDDPALPTLRAFVGGHPELDARIVFTNPSAAINPKIAQLLGLEKVATGEIFLISDANVRVRPDYLEGVVAALLEPGVGLVSNVISGEGEQTWGAALENLHLGAQIAPGVVGMEHAFGRVLTIGKSMAMWRRDLARVGGFASVGSVLAEDYVLGRRFREYGLGVSIVLSPVANRNVACDFRRMIERHTRWAQMRRAIVPLAFLFEPLLSPIAIAIAGVLVAPTMRMILMALAVTVIQVLGAALTSRVIRGHALPARYLLLEPVRALAVQLCWVRAALSRRVDWRGHPFLIGRDSVLTPCPLTAPHRPLIPSGGSYRHQGSKEAPWIH